MVLNIRKLGNPVLRCASKDTEIKPRGLKKIVEEMGDTLYQAKGLGLAGPQVGILKRMFVYDLGEGLQVMLNPAIVWQSEESIEDTEGCLSIPGHEMTVKRAAKVKIEGYDLSGKLKTVEAEGLMARMFQHEIDHLNGILIIDRTTENERREVMKEMIKEGPS